MAAIGCIWSIAPIAPTLNAATGHVLQHCLRLPFDKFLVDRKPVVVARCRSAVAIAVITLAGWQPMLAIASRSACRPVAPVASDSAKTEHDRKVGIRGHRSVSQKERCYADAPR